MRSNVWNANLSKESFVWSTRAQVREQEFRTFVLASQPRLLRFAELLTGDRGHAEDLAQHGFAKAFASWGRLRSGNPEQYVRRCIINANTDRWRRGNWREHVTPRVEDGRIVEDMAIRLAERDAVMRALAALTSTERAVIALRYYQELSEAEIASELDIPAGTVKSTAARALAKLRQSAELRSVDDSHPAKEGGK